MLFLRKYFRNQKININNLFISYRKKKKYNFLRSLTYEDSVSFYSMLNRLRTMEYAIKNSGWLMLDSVDALFKNAKERVYNEKNGEFA